MKDRNFAVLIDEAHSSQSGIATDKLNASLSRDEDQNGGDIDELIDRLIQERKMSPNASYFAFTATPKRETLERFGNGFPDSKTPQEFETPGNRILVVANKYLTGFDQELLSTMYIDKPLGGILAVQTLSRLNRISPENNKRNEDIFVLDFVNSVDDMKVAFDNFYTSTTLDQATDPNVLSELRNTLLELGVFTEDEVEQFNELFHKGAEQDELLPILDTAQNRYDNEIEWPENGQADFNMKCKQFVKVYSRIAALMVFDAPAWEKLYWYLRLLIPQLKLLQNGGIDISDLLDNTNFNTYCLSRTALNEHIQLDTEETRLDPLAPKMVNAGDEDDRTAFDIILEYFNERHMNGWDATPEEQRTKVVRIAQIVTQQQQYQNTVVGNPDTDAAERMFQDILNRAMAQQRTADLTLYRQFRADETFRHDFANLVRAAIENVDYITAQQYTITPNTTTSLAAEP